MNAVNAVFLRMVAHEAGVPGRIQHFVKVHGFAVRIGQMEGMDADALRTLEIAALMHDIGIKPAFEKFGSAAGNLQEQEGPPIAEAILRELGLPEAVVERVDFLIGHHHTYENVIGTDYQILLEADYLVNFFEGSMNADAIRATVDDVFVTESGKQICRVMFGL